MKTLFSTLALTLLLTACGSSGTSLQELPYPNTHQGKPSGTQAGNNQNHGGNHPATNPPNTTAGNPNNGGNSNQPPTHPPSTKTQIHGHYLVNTRSKDDPDKTVLGDLHTSNGQLNVLRINDTEIELVPTQLADILKEDPNFFQWRTPVLDGVIGTHLQHARYGLVIDDAGTPESDTIEYFFAQGKRSPSIPNQGTAKYQGQALISLTRLNLDVLVGKSNFTVDFGAKELNGTLSFNNQYPDVKLRADIQGSSFQGKAGNFFTQGAFYGDNGAELAGTFDQLDANGKHYHNRIGGAFGASKQ